MNNTILEIFKIEKIGKRIGVRCLFVFLLVVNLYVLFFPIGDSNFEPYMNWFQYAMQNPEVFENININDIPLSFENIKYLLSILFIAFLDILSSWIYTGSFIRNYRKAKNPDKVISISKFVFRVVLLAVISSILLTLFSFFVLYLGIFFIIIFPYLIMFPACYLSGDKSFIGSISGMFEVTRGYYLINSRNLSVIFCVYLIGRLIISGLMSLSVAASVAMTPFLNIFILLSLGRYVGIIYLRMLQVPGGLGIIITTNNNNDVQTPEEKN